MDEQETEKIKEPLKPERENIAQAPPGNPPPTAPDATMILSKQEQEAYSDKVSSELRYRIITQAQNEDDRILIVLYKSLDLMDGQQLREELSHLTQGPILKWDLDLTPLVYCDSATLSICVMVKLIANHYKGKVVIHLRHESLVHQIIRNSKLDRILELKFE